MADTYIVSSSDLTTVADSIRAKTGGTEQLTFPTGFANAIGGIGPEKYTFDQRRDEVKNYL